MKSPVDTVKGRIVGYDEKRGELLIRAPYDDYITLTKREYKTCLVQLVDNRPLSDKQRRMCYALLGVIADYSGYSKGQIKELMKLKFLADELNRTADAIFSLSNAPMSLVCAFQRFLVRFILDYDIPCEDINLLDYVDDVQDYVYSCATRKRCCVCGKPAEAHHHNRIGMGRNREEVDHLGMMMQPLCREHHTECHTMPQAEFDAKYHIEPVEIDRALIKVWRLNSGIGKHDRVEK